ncbi:Alanyl-tRNA editing protein Aarsd1 [Homalodisca vitripennis]|nr:Alanyl-tRNA editing protein Aarsd1 [Homalodisca vitripennis]
MFAEGGRQATDVGKLRKSRDTEPIVNIEVDVYHVLRGANGKNVHLISETVTSYVYNQGESDARLEKARTKGLSDNYGDFIRVVQIGELVNNMCCGTHATRLSQLELIEVLRVEKGKKKEEEGKKKAVSYTS